MGISIIGKFALRSLPKPLGSSLLPDKAQLNQYLPPEGSEICSGCSIYLYLQIPEATPRATPRSPEGVAKERDAKGRNSIPPTRKSPMRPKNLNSPRPYIKTPRQPRVTFHAKPLTLTLYHMTKREKKEKAPTTPLQNSPTPKHPKGKKKKNSLLVFFRTLQCEMTDRLASFAARLCLTAEVITRRSAGIQRQKQVVQSVWPKALCHPIGSFQTRTSLKNRYVYIYSFFFSFRLRYQSIR